MENPSKFKSFYFLFLPQKVKTLILSGCSRISSQAFEILANNIPYAVRLDFSKTKISTLAIQSLFRSCCDLQDLALRHCQVREMFKARIKTGREFMVDGCVQLYKKPACFVQLN